MNVPFFDYRRFLTVHRKEIDNAIKRVLDSGNLILGQYVVKLEHAFADFTGAKYALGVASGTDALFLALKALNISPGDEVITVPNTAVPTVSAIVSAGAIPRFADIHAGTYLIDPISLKKSITKKAKAIIPVHLFGQSCDMERIMQIAAQNRLHVIEDCAQAHGALFCGHHVGIFGICGCFSFYPTKNCGAFGDGGMIITNSASLYKKLKALRNYGQYTLNKNSFHGYNSRLDELQASLLLVKLKYLKKRNTLRQKHADHYSSLLKNISIKCPEVSIDCTHVFHQFVIKVRNRNNVRKKLAEKGVITGIHYPTTIYKQKAYKHFVNNGFSCPVSEQVQRSIISLPIFPELTEKEIDYTCSTLQKIVS